MNQEWEPEGKTVSPRRVVAAIGLGVGALLLLLSWLGTSAVPVTEEQFRRLADADLIRAVNIGSSGVEARLAGPVRVHSRDRDAVTDHVYLPVATPPSGADLDAWEARGIAVTEESAYQRNLHEIAGALLLLCLLGGGLWYMWLQIREDRHGAGSPRRRLRELEMALADSTISEEEYRRQAEKIWAEM